MTKEECSNIRCEECGKVIGTYHGGSFFVIALKTIGGLIISMKIGAPHNVSSGDVDAEIVCPECLDKVAFKVKEKFIRVKAGS